MGKVYVPNYSSGNCVVIRDNNTIRVYSEQPRQNSTVTYTDYYIHSDYYSNSGSSQFTQYSTLPSCLSSSMITTEYGYRVDFPVTCLCALAILFTGYFFVSKCVRTLFVDWRYC